MVKVAKKSATEDFTKAKGWVIGQYKKVNVLFRERKI